VCGAGRLQRDEALRWARWHTRYSFNDWIYCTTCGDLIVAHAELEIVLLDVEHHMFGDFVFVDHAPDPHADLGAARQAPARNARLYFLKLLLRGLQQRLTLVSAQPPELRGCDRQ
jgi:hypothetical protein